MTETSATPAPGGTGTERAPDLLTRLIQALPLIGAFTFFCLVYGFQASRHGTPWLFGDELQFTQISRSIAEHGSPARRGEAIHRLSLYPYLTAPAWWIDSTESAYAVAKTIGVLVMSAAIFPAYALGRLVVSRPAAFFAAVASVSIPAFAYTSFLVEEPLAYFWSILCLYLIVRALTERGVRLALLAAAACVVAPFVRNQLVVLPAIFGLGALWLGWTSEQWRARRRGWSRGDWLGAVTLFVGAVIVVNAFVGRHSLEWEIATRLYKDRMLEYGLWAFGAFAIGLGVFPIAAWLTSLWPRSGAAQREAERCFTIVSVASIGTFGFYTAVKSAYVSVVFSTLIYERNLMYLAPLAFIGAALALERGRVRLRWLALVTVFLAYVLQGTPYQMRYHFISDAPGLAILAWLNRTFAWTPETARAVLLWMLAVSTLVLLLSRVPKPFDRGARQLGVAAAALALAWNLTGAITAGNASNSFAKSFRDSQPDPIDWVDRLTGGEPTVYIGQQIADPNGINLTEFWNRSIKKVWSLDGTAERTPGPTYTPDLISRFGTLTGDPGYPYVLADNGVEIVGDKVLTRDNGLVLYRIRPPLRLASAVSGVYADGWLGTGRDDLKQVTAGYSQFATPGNKPGVVLVTVSRTAACSKKIPTGRVNIKSGALAIGPDRHPALGEQTYEIGWRVGPCAEREFPIPTPRPPFQVQVTVSPTFVPREIDPRETDGRHLAAKVSFRFVPG